MILIIDNYDSFTYNLARYFEELGESVKVIKNDELSLFEIERLSFSHLVISPGPCTPKESGVCLQAIEHFCAQIPILGVCLGHQAIAQVHGASIKRATNVVHGKTSQLQVVDKHSTLFANCPTSFEVTRYHSLIIDEESLAPEFSIAAICQTNGVREVMAIENRAQRLYGVQFHPESLLTEHGHQMLGNFVENG